MKKVFLMLCMALLLVSTVSAVLDVKTFDPKVKDHGEIKIKDWLFLNKADYRLTDYEDSVLDVWAEGEYKLYKKTHLFTNVFYKDIGQNRGDLKDVNFFIWVNESYTVDTPIFISNCVENPNPLNATEICTSEQTGTTTETKYNAYWKPYNKGDELEEQEGRWRFEAKRPINKKVDFILEAHGKEFNEWAWFNNSWEKKQEIKIEEKDGDLVENYSILLNITYDSDMNSDFSDLRFLDSTETVELQYWIENKVNSNYAEVYVKVPTLTASANTSIYMYYGNALATTDSNSEGIWLFYEDWDTFDTGVWSVTTQDGTIGVSGSRWYSTLSAGVTGNNIETIETFSGNLEVIYEDVQRSNSDSAGVAVNMWANADDHLHASHSWKDTYSYIKTEGYDKDLNQLITYWGSRTQNLDFHLYNKPSWKGVNATDGAVIKKVMEYSNPNYPIDTPVKLQIVAQQSQSGSATEYVGDVTVKRWTETTPTVEFQAEESANALVLTLNEPIDNYNSTVEDIDFNCNATDNNGVYSLNLTINGSIYETVTGAGSTNLSLTSTETLADGVYNWYCTANDDIEAQNSTTRTLTVDTIKPNFTVISPLTNFTALSLPYNVTLNVTTQDTNLNTCWYYTSDNSTNVTYTCNTGLNISFETGGYKTIYNFANDTYGNENVTSKYFLINYVTKAVNYTTPVIEGVSTTLNYDLTATIIDTINGTLHYNGENYNLTIENNGTNANFTTTLNAPAVDANEDITFNWTYSINGVDYNSSNYVQTVQHITPIELSASCTDKALRFDLTDEQNGSAISGDIEYNFKYGTYNSTQKEIYGSLTGLTTFYLCVNGTLSENYTLGYGEIQYRTSEHVDRRYYTFEDRELSNATLTNVTLRNLKNTEQTSFILELEDTSLNKYINKYTALWRWYPALNEYKIVEMGKTDEDGQTVAHVDTEDVDYRLGLYELDGTLIKLGDPKRYVCTLSPCTFTLTVDAEELDYSSLLDVQAEITYNETSGIFTLIYNDPNQYTSLMRLEVTRETGDNVLTICNATSTEFTGVLSCDTSAYTGFKRAVAYRSASPEAPLAQKTTNDVNRSWVSALGLFLSIILWLAVILSGLGSSPVLTVILSVVALIPALVFGAINFAIFTGVAVLGAIVLHFIKRALAF